MENKYEIVATSYEVSASQTLSYFGSNRSKLKQNLDI